MVRCNVLGLVLLVACPAVSHAETVISVVLDRAKVIALPASVATIVVGNPAIADVTALKGGTAYVLTGKGYGETNLLLLDRTGSAIAEDTIQVVPATQQLVVQRGTAQTSYSCTPVCGPTVTLGDADDALKGASGQITSRNALALPSGSSTSSNSSAASATSGLAAGQAEARESGALPATTSGQSLLNTAPSTSAVSH